MRLFAALTSENGAGGGGEPCSFGARGKARQQLQLPACLRSVSRAQNRRGHLFFFVFVLLQMLHSLVLCREKKKKVGVGGVLLQVVQSLFIHSLWASLLKKERQRTRRGRSFVCTSTRVRLC